MTGMDRSFHCKSHNYSLRLDPALLDELTPTCHFAQNEAAEVAGLMGHASRFVVELLLHSARLQPLRSRGLTFSRIAAT